MDRESKEPPKYPGMPSYYPVIFSLLVLLFLCASGYSREQLGTCKRCVPLTSTQVNALEWYSPFYSPQLFAALQLCSWAIWDVFLWQKTSTGTRNQCPLRGFTCKGGRKKLRPYQDRFSHGCGQESVRLSKFKVWAFARSSQCTPITYLHSCLHWAWYYYANRRRARPSAR